MSTNEKTFPIQHCPEIPSIPWRLVEPHTRQIEKNHSGQTLEQLAQRGGLDVIELWGAMNGKAWSELLAFSTQEQAKNALLDLLRKWD